jgi:hypothetical protein
MGNWSDLKTALHYGQVLGTRAGEAINKVEKRSLRRLFPVDGGMPCVK